MEMGHGGVHKGSEKRKKMLEMGEEWRVIEGPWAGFIRVPLRKRERMSYSEPITVDFEICAVISWD